MNKAYDILRRGVWQTSRVANYAATAFLVMMMLLVVIDVTLRKTINAGITESYDLILLFMVCLVYFAVAYTATLKGHIVIDLVSSRLPERARPITARIAYSITIVVCGLIAWQSVVQAIIAQNLGNAAGYTILYIPLFPFLYLIFFGFALMALVYLINLIDSLREGAKQ